MINTDKILCKAKSKKDGEWVEGYYIKYQPCASKEEYIYGIVPTYASALYIIEIDPDTLCQYTGLTNMEGKMIWENDIVYNGNTSIIKWNEPCARWDMYIVDRGSIPIGAWKPLVVDWKTSDWKEYSNCYQDEVIGNIFDNPELLHDTSRLRELMLSLKKRSCQEKK